MVIRSTPGTRLRHLGRRRDAVVELHAIAQAAQRAPAHVALHLGQVLLLDAVAGVRQPVGEVAVVGQQQQALGGHVEAADGVHPRFVGHEVHHGGPALRVAGGGDHPDRLVEQVVHQPGLRTPMGTPSTSTRSDSGVDAPPEHGDLAVHRDPPGADEVLAHAAAPPARGTTAPSAGARPAAVRPTLPPTAPTAAARRTRSPVDRDSGSATGVGRRVDAQAVLERLHHLGAGHELGDRRQIGEWRSARASPGTPAWCRTGSPGRARGRGPPR